MHLLSFLITFTFTLTLFLSRRRLISTASVSLLLMEVLPADFLPQSLSLLIFFNDLIDTIFVIESFHFRVPLFLLGVFDLEQGLVLGTQLVVIRGQFDGLLEVVLGSIEIILGAVSLRHPVVHLGVVLDVLQSRAAILNALLMAASFELTQGAISIENIQDVLSLLLLLLCKGLLLAFGHVFED